MTTAAPFLVRRGRVLLAAFLAAASLLFASPANAAVSYDRRSLVINGRHRILISGSIHYPRSTPEVSSPNAACFSRPEACRRLTDRFLSLDPLRMERRCGRG
jgi:hypothetical protein